MPASLRIVTINFWGTEAPLEKRLSMAARQLRDLSLDVVAMQEVRPLDGRNGKTTADVLAQKLGFRQVYEVSLRWKDNDFFDGFPGGEEGLAILSRFPIRSHRVVPLPEARPTEARILLSACLDTPVGMVWCHTTHLHYRLDDGLAREKQVIAIDQELRKIETDAPQILCGDFNATPEHDEIRFLLGLTTLQQRRTHYQDAFARIHPDEPGLTWCSENENTRALRSLDIDRRIDYVFVTTRRKDGRGTILGSEVVLTERSTIAGAIPRPVEGICASDHYGVFANIQIEPGVMHAGDVSLVA